LSFQQRLFELYIIKIFFKLKFYMENLHKFLVANKVKNILAVFAHPDDESFVSGGLFQELQKLNIQANLICLTKGGRGLNPHRRGNLKEIRTGELEKAVKILGIDNCQLWDFPDADLKSTKDKWLTVLKNEVEKIKPDLILTFDPSGITGHPDHIVSCIETLDAVKKLKNPPIVIWRVPDEQEKLYFKNNKALMFACVPNLVLNYGLTESLNKIKAIFSHASQMKSLRFKLQILEWFLFDHKEFYYKVNLNQKYKYKFVYYRIDKDS